MSAEQTLAQSEAPPKEVFRQRKNQRNLVTKLELPDDPFLQQKKIAEKVFDTPYDVTKPAKDHSDWQTTDEYFERAKSSYDSVIAPFQKAPKVYKLEKATPTKAVIEPVPVLEKTSQEIDDDLDTMIDPYAIPKPWVIKYDRDDNMYYFNPVTGARKIIRPDDVWKEKLERLDKLVPREDYSGWEYKEDDKEKRARLRTQLLFDKKLNEEIKRRQENPTDDEIVEDALYDIVRKIEADAQREIDKEVNRRRKELRAMWHPSSIGHRMKQLELLPRPEQDDDANDHVNHDLGMDRRITDLDYEDILVLTETGFSLPKTMPADLLEIHEAEREEKRLLREEIEMEEERIRRLPVLEKATMLVAQALEEGPKEAAKSLARGIEYRAMVIPRKLKSLDRRIVVAKSQEAIVSGVSSLLKATRNPAKTAREVSSNLTTIYRQMFPPKQEGMDMNTLMNELDEEADKAEADAKRAKEEALALSLKANRIQAKPRDSKYSSKRRGGLSSDAELVRPPVKVELPDCTLVTITLQIAAPRAAALEHTAGEKMFIKARDKLIQKSIAIKKEKELMRKRAAEAEVDLVVKERPAVEFRHNFNHDDESSTSTPKKVVKPITLEGKPKGKIQHRKKKPKLNIFTGEIEEEILDSDEEELRKAKENLPSFLQDPPMKYNNSARKQFESQLIFDLAIACGIPENYFTIEEVRNLPDNDPKVAAFIERNKDVYAAELIQLAEEEEERKRIALLEQNEMIEFALIHAKKASVPIKQALKAAKDTSTKFLSTLPEDAGGIFGTCLPRKHMIGAINDTSTGSIDEVADKENDDNSVGSLESFGTDNTRNRLAAEAISAQAELVVAQYQFVPTEAVSVHSVSTSRQNLGHDSNTINMTTDDVSNDVSTMVRQMRPEKMLANELVMSWMSDKYCDAANHKPSIGAPTEVQNLNSEPMLQSEACSANFTIAPPELAFQNAAFSEGVGDNPGSNIVVNPAQSSEEETELFRSIDNDELTIDSRMDFKDTHSLGKKDDSDNLSPSPMKAILPSIPKMPEKFVLGITNPKDLFERDRETRVNINFWQNKDIKMSTEDELQMKRLKHLKATATLMLPDSDNADGDILRGHIAKETAKRHAKLKLEWLQEQRDIVKQLAKVQMEANLAHIKDKTAVVLSKLKKADETTNCKVILPPIEPDAGDTLKEIEQEEERQKSIKALDDIDKILSEQEDDLKQTIDDTLDEERVDGTAEIDEGKKPIEDVDNEICSEKQFSNSNDSEEIGTEKEISGAELNMEDDTVALDMNLNAGEENGNGSNSAICVYSGNEKQLVPCVTIDSNSSMETEVEETEELILRSCEVSFLIRLDDAVRCRHEGLADLKSADIAKYIEVQMSHQFSDLLKGSIARYIVNVRFKPHAFGPKYFTKWEQRWVYIISPTYFGYSTKKSERKSRNKGREKGLPNGLQVKNPVSDFTEDEKTTYMALGGGKLPARKNADGQEDDTGPVIDLDVDDIAAELGIGEGSSGPKIYRPNMAQLNQREIEKCKRIYKAFQEVFEIQMKRGLVDGKRLRREQFDAMKDRDTAKRIYDIAKQKLNRDSRLANDTNKFVPHMTRITDEVFSSWKKELDDEEDILLRDKKRKAEEARENRRKMANSRKLYETQRVWMVAKLTSLSSTMKLMSPFGPAFQEELESDLRDLAKIHNPEVNALEILKIKTQLSANEKLQKQEEKMTKQLYSNIAMWVHQNAIIKEFQDKVDKLVHVENCIAENSANDNGEENVSVISVASDEQGWEKDQHVSDKRRQSIPFRRVSFAEEDVMTGAVFEQIHRLNESNADIDAESSLRSTAGSDLYTHSVLGLDGERIPSYLETISNADSFIDPSKRKLSISSEASEFSGLVGKSRAIGPSQSHDNDNVTTNNTRRNSATVYDDAVITSRRRSLSSTAQQIESEVSNEKETLLTKTNEMSDAPVSVATSGQNSSSSSGHHRRLSAISSREAVSARRGSVQMNTGVLLGVKSTLSVPSVDSVSLSLAAEAPFIARKEIFSYVTKAREAIVFKTNKQETGRHSEVQQVILEQNVISDTVNQKVPFQKTVSANELSCATNPMNGLHDIRIGLDGNAVFSEVELELLSQVKWINIISTVSEFRACMQTIITDGKNDFTREELLLFARLVVDLEPAFMRAKVATTKLTAAEKKTTKIEDEGGIKVPGQRKKKSKHEEMMDALARGDGKELLSTSVSSGKLSREEGLRRESMRRASNFTLASMRRKMREKAWKTAHQHLFIKMPDKPKYCVVCAEKELEGWLADHDKAEGEWRKVPEGEFADFLEERVEFNEPIFQKEEENLVLAEMQEEANLKAEKNAEKKRSEALRRENVMKARQGLYNRVRTMDPSILNQPIESFIEKNHFGDVPVVHFELNSNVKRDEAMSSPEVVVPKVDTANLLRRIVVKDLVNAMADAISIQESIDKLYGTPGSTAGDSLEMGDNSDDLGSFASSVTVHEKLDGEPSTVPVKIPKYILDSNLSLVDATGLSIIPQEASVVNKGDEKGLKFVTPITDLNQFYLENIVKAAESGDILSAHLLEGFISKGLDSKDIKGSIESGFNLSELFPEISSFDKCSHEILIRVWNKDADNPNKTGKGDFLGFIILNSADLKDPPKGIRALSLMPDESLSTPKGVDKDILKVVGSLSVKLSATKWMNGTETNTNKIGFPCEWRLQVVKASKIALVDRNTKTSSFCEIFWRGRAIRCDIVEHYSNWLVIGKTTVVARSLDPSWSKEPTALLELPPRWTECDIPSRGPEDGPLQGGGWVAINHVPADDKTISTDKGGSLLTRMSKKEHESKQEGAAKTKAVSNKFDPRKALRGAVDAVRVASRLNARAMLKIKIRVEDRIKTMKLLFEQQENERYLMAAEERRMRINNLALSKIEEEPYVLEQKLFEREFTRLIQAIHEAPRIVARLRFLMASLTSSGGLLVICEDPATKKELDVVSLPLMYEQDENELSVQILELLGTPHKNLVNIVDFSVHQILGFNFNGSASTNERGALIVTNHPKGVPLSEYMAENWMLMSDNDFRLILVQIARALAALHRHNINHRNLHPDAVTIYDPKEYQAAHGAQAAGTWGLGAESFGQNDSSLNAQSEPSISSSTTMPPELSKSLSFDPRLMGQSKESINYMHTGWGTKNSNNKNPVIELGDYWFLSNPRKPGCQYSNGRADWGHRHTAPPEVLFGQNITERSDIWAFGICCFHWATEGLYPDVSAGKGGLVDLESLIKKLPLKWGPWLHSLLRMCLQKVPRNRAIADDLFRFLTLAKAAKENSTK